jgi:hypothetical protein
VIATVSTPRISAVTGGLAAVVGAGLIAVTLPAFVAYRHLDSAESP